MKELKHGGNIFEASLKYNIPVDKWNDLSTGISPFTYPVPSVPQHIYARLPYQDPDFTKAVHSYYKSQDFLAVAGSQTAIEQLPIFLKTHSKIKKVVVPKIGYQEHQYHFTKQNFRVEHYDSFDNQTAFSQLLNKQTKDCHILIIQPNNPTGMIFNTEQIKELLNNQSEDTYLIMDEAFIDASSQNSCIELIEHYSNLIILRSVGKFFGLAGLRLGFIFAQPSIIKTLNTQIGKWQVSSPTQFIATQALQDQNFHKQTQINIIDKNKQTKNIFKEIELLSKNIFISELFISYLLDIDQAQTIFDNYAKQGILLRLIEIDEATSLIRVGL